jgi:hypothetical protein
LFLLAELLPETILDDVPAHTVVDLALNVRLLPAYLDRRQPPED